MQALDLPCNSSLDPRVSDPFAMSERSPPIHHPSQSPGKEKAHVDNNAESESIKENHVKNDTVGENNGSSSSVVVRRERPSRACTQRAAARLQAAAEAEAERKRKRKKGRRRERLAARLLREESDEDEGFQEEEEEENGGTEENGEEVSRVPCSRIITPLLGEPEASQLPRWRIRSMWQLASILNFFNVFRHLLNIKVEFSAEEFETALISPNNTLADIHLPLLKAIRPVTRMALGRHTWITVLCRKLRDWWHWVAEGDIPIVASHGTEVETYNALDPGMRVVILKAICDIRVEQEDIRSYIDDSIKHGVQLSMFRKERIGGDSYGVSYWYEDDPIIGYRLYREIIKVEVKKGKGRHIPPIPHSLYQWEAVATNLDEFITVSEKLFSSKNRTEVSVGKKLKNDLLPDIEKVHKKKEKLLKKQHRQALMLDSMMNMDVLAGRSLRDRKPVTYTFDDFDRSINEAIKVTKKKQSSPEPFERRDHHPQLHHHVKFEVSKNGKWGGPSQCTQPLSSNEMSPKSLEYNEFYEDKKNEALDRRKKQSSPEPFERRDHHHHQLRHHVKFEVSKNDDFDRSINEAIKVTKKKQSSTEPFERRDHHHQLRHHVKFEVSENGKWGGPSQCTQPLSSNEMSPKSLEYNEFYEDKKNEALDRSNRRRQRPQRYSEKEFVEALSDNDGDFDSDGDIVGEVVYHDEYIEKRKQQKKMSSSSEGDEEYHWDKENPEEEEEAEDEMLSTSEDSDRPKKFRSLPGRTRREMKLRSVDELQLGLRRSKRSTRNRINYRKYVMSESDNELIKPGMSKALSGHREVSDNAEFSTGSQNFDEKINEPDMHADPPIEEPHPQMVDEKLPNLPDRTSQIDYEEDRVGKIRYLDLNELATVSGLDDVPSSAKAGNRGDI